MTEQERLEALLEKFKVAEREIDVIAARTVNDLRAFVKQVCDRYYLDYLPSHEEHNLLPRAGCDASDAEIGWARWLFAQVATAWNDFVMGSAADAMNYFDGAWVPNLNHAAGDAALIEPFRPPALKGPPGLGQIPTAEKAVKEYVAHYGAMHGLQLVTTIRATGTCWWHIAFETFDGDETAVDEADIRFINAFNWYEAVTGQEFMWSYRNGTWTEVFDTRVSQEEEF